MKTLSCLENQKNIGFSRCKKFPQQMRGMITTPFNFELSEADANDPVKWQAAILAEKKNRIYYWPSAVMSENVNEDTQYENTNLADILVREGRYAWRFQFRENLKMHKAMFSHKGFFGRVFLIDINNNVVGTETNTGGFKGFEISLLNPEKFVSGDVSSKTPVYLSLYDHTEFDNRGVMIDGSFLRQLERLTDADLEIVGTPTATTITVDVKSALDNEPVLGLVVADFVLLDSSGTAQTISSISESTTVEGRYTLTGTAFVSGTLDLADPDALSIVGFDGIPVTVTI